jgi:hypothetical protein
MRTTLLLPVVLVVGLMFVLLSFIPGSFVEAGE